MTQFKKMKMRTNNPDHSKAVQEWLFEQGYGWTVYGRQFKDWGRMWEEGCFLYTTSKGEIFWDKEGYYHDYEGEEINVQHLDPHLHSLYTSQCVYRETGDNTFNNMLTNLKHVQKAIEKADNKQQKRLQDRDRMMQKINDMLPEGFVVQCVENKSECNSPEKSKDFSPEEITVGSVWLCLSDPCKEWSVDMAVGAYYELVDNEGGIGVIDDVGHMVGIVDETCVMQGRPELLREHFKRIS